MRTLTVHYMQTQSTQSIQGYNHFRMASTQKVRLLSAWASLYSMRVKLALTLKGIEYEDLPQDLINKSKLLLDSNPIHKKVPVLFHNGKPLIESAIIVQYIEEAWPDKAPRLLPQDAFLRAEHRFWTDFIDKKLGDSLTGFLGSEDNAAVNDEFNENWKMLEGALAKLGGEGPFFGQSTLSFLDVMLAPYSVAIPAMAGALGFKTATEEKCPHLHRWLAAIQEHPATKVVVPPVAKLEDFLRFLVPVLRNKSTKS